MRRVLPHLARCEEEYKWNWPGDTRVAQCLVDAGVKLEWVRSFHSEAPTTIINKKKPPPVVGELARRRGVLTPDRLVVSAKSWLCHPGVDRKGAILPWGSPEEIAKRSPVEIDGCELRDELDAWRAGVHVGAVDARVDIR